LEDSLGYTVRFHLKNKNKTKKTKLNQPKTEEISLTAETRGLKAR
jgi:hypothetical protein